MPFTPPPASEQTPLSLGERLCDLPLHDVRGQVRSLYDTHYFGWPKVIHVANGAQDAAPELMRLAEHLKEFRRAETHVFGVTRGPAAENAALAQQMWRWQRDRGSVDEVLLMWSSRPTACTLLVR